MMKGKLFVIGIALAWIVACTQTTDEKTQLTSGDVAKMEIMSNGSENQLEKSVKTLNRAEINRFVEMWNSSEPADNCKFHPEYEIRAFLKDGSKITFRMNDKSIQENSGTCYYLDYKKLVKLIED